MSLLSHSEMTIVAVTVASSELVFVRHILEASEGLGFVVGERGGDVLLACSLSQTAEMERFIEDMKLDVGLRCESSKNHQGAYDVAQ